MHTYFLIFVINLLKAYSQPYILMTLIPLMTSLINFTLVSVTFAALNLHKKDYNTMHKNNINIATLLKSKGIIIHTSFLSTGNWILIILELKLAAVLREI